MTVEEARALVDRMAPPYRLCADPSCKVGSLRGIYNIRALVEMVKALLEQIEWHETRAKTHDADADGALHETDDDIAGFRELANVHRACSSRLRDALALLSEFSV